MSLLGLAGVSFAYSHGTPLFEDVSFSVNLADRIAVVGPNGAGKSTLLRLLAGELEPVSGAVVRRSPLRLAVAEQTPATGEPATLFDFVFSAHTTLAPLRRGLRELECDLERDPADALRACEYATRINEYEEHGGYAAEAAVARILGGLGYPEPDFERSIETLSGGERTRASLARALSMDSDLLILDEPTNHLDIGAREWLEEHLRNRQAATVLTSHDRTLLTAFATRIVEIERGRWRVFEGGFDAYRAARTLLDRQAREAYDAFERRRAVAERAAQRRSQLAQRVAATPEGGAGVRNPFYAHKASKVARTARLLRERVSEKERVEKPWEETPIDGLTFDGVPRGGDLVLTVQGLAKAYAERSLFRGLSFTVRRGDRLVIRGANGTGKSTLLKMIQGRVEPDAGTVTLGAKVRAASVDQVPEDLDLALTPLELCGSGTHARTLLACLKLRPDRVNRPLRELSGGERTKVALARVLGSGANLLLLDEPTNHLEIEAQEALEQALQRYPGTLILVSHDRSFLAGLGALASYLDLG